MIIRPIGIKLRCSGTNREAPEPAAAETGLARRRSKLTGPILAPTLVFGWLSDPAASLAALTQQSAALGAPVSPQGLFQRFGP